MAAPVLAVGDIVTPATSVTPGGSAVNGQIQMRGVIEKVDNTMAPTNADVLWDTGAVEKAIPVASLDRIDPPDPGSQGLQGQVVRRVLSAPITASAAYDALVLELYKRTNGATRTPTADIALTRTLLNPTLFELFAATLETVPGR